MKLITLVLSILFASMSLTLQSTAAEKIMPTSMAEYENIVIAVHPYFSKKDLKHFNLGRDKDKDLIPIGVFVLNNGKNRIALGKIDVGTANERKVFAPQYSPYGKRAMGAIADRTIFYDGEELGRTILSSYKNNEARPVLKMNEIFHISWLEKDVAYYGIVYLDERNDKLRPIKIKSLDGLTLKVHVWMDDFKKYVVAELPLDGTGAGSVQSVKDEKIGKNEFRCENELCKKMSAVELYTVNQELSNCEARSISKNANIKGTYWGKQALARVVFSKEGNFLSHEMIRKSGDKKIDAAMDKVIKGMLSCDVSYAGKSGYKENEAAFYSLVVEVGDIVSAE